MKKYIARFVGRSRGALGITHPCKTTIEGKDEHDALMNLYDAFEHISHATFEEVPNDDHREKH